MSKNNLIVVINSYDDISKIDETTKYININIDNYNKEIIDYFINNGQNYSYSDISNGKLGYAYISYDVFVKSESVIEDIVNSCNDLDIVDKVRYVYIALGRMLSYDINILPDKNENFSFEMECSLNNIWGCIYNKKCTKAVVVKILHYLLTILGVEDIIVDTEDLVCNKVKIDGIYYIVNLYEDLPFIQARFRTQYFSNYNDDKELDKRIGYIEEEYNDILIDNELKSLSRSDSEYFSKLLGITQSILDISKISSLELGIIYNLIFVKYLSMEDVHINNLFVNSIYNSQEHFILITYNNIYYSYNYKLGRFVVINSEDLINNINSNKVGVYLGEEVLGLNMGFSR